MVKLQKQIESLNQNISLQLPPEIISAFGESISGLKNQNIENNAVKKGTKISPFALLSANGMKINSSELLTKYDLIVLAFFRGNWCPYCSLELKALQDSLTEIENKKVKLLAISPQKAKYSRIFADENKISFDMLHDENNQLAKAFGITFSLQENIIPIYKQLNIDLKIYNGNDSNTLPMPAVFAIDANHKIIYSFVDANYMNRVDIDELIQNL